MSKHLTEEEVKILTDFYKKRNTKQLYNNIKSWITNIISLGVLIFVTGLLIKGIIWVFNI